MRVQAELRYVETYLPPRCRKPREVALLSTHDVEVPEVSAAQAPVALVCPNPDHGGRDKRAVNEYRWHGGRLWLPADRPAEDLVSVGNGYSWLTAEAKPRAGWEAEQPPGTAINRGMETHAKGQAEAAAASLLLIDGEVWREAREPYLSISVHGFGSNAYVRVRSSYGDGRNAYNHLDFGIGQLAEAVNHCSANGWRLDGVPAPVAVHIPEALRLRPREWALAEAVAKARDAVAAAVRWNGLGAFGEEVKRRETLAILRDVLARVEAGEEADAAA